LNFKQKSGSIKTFIEPEIFFQPRIFVSIKLITFISIKTSNFENQATKNQYDIFKSPDFFGGSFCGKLVEK